MSLMDELKQIKPADEAAMAATQQHWDEIAKPVGSLGKMEQILVRVAGASGRTDGIITPRRLVVFAADNGVLAQGVAQTPGEITAVMTELIAEGKSAVGIMASVAQVEMLTVDMGVARRMNHPKVIDRHLMDGTEDFTKGPAMSRETAVRALEIGMEFAKKAAEDGVRLLITGEMGIGNTTTTAAVTCAILGESPENLTGRGVGLTDEGLLRKQNAVKTGLAVNKPDPKDGVDVLAKVGGLDIAGMCGLFLGGAAYGVPVLIDGVISQAAALLAKTICPASTKAMIATHFSAEPAAKRIFAALGLEPVLCADMRLGEGTGALATLPAMDVAAKVYRELTTLEAIGL